MTSDTALQSSKYFRAYEERSWLERQWFRFSVWAVGTFFRLACRLRIEGGNHIPLQGSVLLVSNHVSMLDALLIPYTVMRLQGLQVVWSPAKEELFQVPIVGTVLRSWGSFPVRRGRGDLRAMRQIMALLRRGKLMLFPEGTRSLDGQLGKGQRTVGKFIYYTRPMVVPIAVCGTERFFPHGSRLPKFRIPIAIHYGAPLDLQHYYALPDSKQTAEAIVQDVMSAIAALQYAVSSQDDVAKR
jgi:1-acyl-sn-glycerol-3-phosphate acyltransferase